MTINLQFSLKQIHLQWTPSISKPKIQGNISGLTKNYSITANMQKINSIHQSILEMEQILESHDQEAMPTFDQANLRIIEVDFNFP